MILMIYLIYHAEGGVGGQILVTSAQVKSDSHIIRLS